MEASEIGMMLKRTTQREFRAAMHDRLSIPLRTRRTSIVLGYIPGVRVDRIDALRLFVRLHEQGSFSAAGRDLKIKQSTASKWIAELERQVGSTLVERTTRSLHLTDAGKLLYTRARVLLAAFDTMNDELSAGRDVPIGRVRLSAPVVFGRLFVTPLLVDFARRHPAIDLDIVLTDRYVNLVEEGVDLAVRVGVPLDTSARGLKLTTSRRYLVASPAYLRANGRPTTPKALKDHQCVLHGEARAATWRFSGAGGVNRPVPISGRITVNNSELALEMARGGVGIALLADWLVWPDLQRKRLVRLLEAHETPPATLYLLIPPGAHTATPIRALRDHLAVTLPATVEEAVSSAG
jgi:DNA-binding transcriptional LysR family regulator